MAIIVKHSKIIINSNHYERQDLEENVQIAKQETLRSEMLYLGDLLWDYTGPKSSEAKCTLAVKWVSSLETIARVQ